MNDLIISIITRLLIPFIQLYGVFLVLTGHLSPGGGFTGGAILGISIVLYTLVYGLNKGSEKMSNKVSSRMEAGGVLIFLTLGLISIFFGFNFLTNKEMGMPMGALGNIVSAGIIPIVSIVIGAKLTTTIATLFHTMIEE